MVLIRPGWYYLSRRNPNSPCRMDSSATVRPQVGLEADLAQTFRPNSRLPPNCNTFGSNKIRAVHQRTLNDKEDASR